MVGWWARGGISVTEGWDALSSNIRRVMDSNPTPQPLAVQVRRERINIRVSDQTGEADMDMPGLSHETRIFEKHDGQWKFVYVGWLLAGE